MKRLSWFAAGAVAGAGGSIYARRKARAAAERYRPVAVVRNTGQAVQRRAGDVGAAVRAGRSTMREREAELLAELDAPVPVDPPEGREDLGALYDPNSSQPESPRGGRRRPRRRSRR